MGEVDEVLTAADRNMEAVWTAVLAGAPAPGRFEDGELVLLSSGIPVPLFNPAYVTARPIDPVAAVAHVVEHYAALGSPFVLSFRDDVAPGLAAACTTAGLVEHWNPALMLLDPVPAEVPEPPAGLVVHEVGDAELAGYGDVLAIAFGMPREIASLLLERSLTELDAFTGFVGTLDGEPVATAGVFVSDGIAGVYNVATRSEHRGRGFGAALTWTAAHAGRALGHTRSVLQASKQGEPVYRRMGYATPARYRQFEPVALPT
ncbi:MAG: acetyltransferase [Acidimicrobiales bacterium]|nr:acetyltransferase [Acidimicrobiales bacterium]